VAAVRENRELIARKGPLGKDVCDDVAEVRHRSTLVPCPPVRRIAIATFAVLLAAGCGSTKQSSPPTSVAATTGSATLPQSSGCLWQQEAGVLADFGQFPSVDAANSEIARAGSAGFRGLVVEQRGCNRYAVVLRGLTSVAQGRSLQREA